MRKLLLAGLLVILVAAGAGGAWLLSAYRSLDRPFAGWEGEGVDVRIEPGTAAAGMVQQLADSGVLSHQERVRAWLSWSGLAGELQAGEYRFDEPASPRAVIERLRRGDVLLHPVTLPEGLDLQEVASRLADAGIADTESLLAHFRDAEPIRDLDPQAEDLEGYLFPDTYHFPRGVSAATVTRTMLGRFREAVGSDFGRRAEEVGLDSRRAVILASLIEEETSLPEERPRISRVFHNRLDRGMRLQCDPTVIYGLKRDGREVGRLTYADLEYDSPWNTYRISGLPRGPIANPGLQSLNAAVSPAAGGELYFVAKPDGGHSFSNDLAGHRRAVARWRAYLRSSR